MNCTPDHKVQLVTPSFGTIHGKGVNLGHKVVAGVTIVCIHGGNKATQSCAVWEPLLEETRRDNLRYSHVQVLAVDMPGYGETPALDKRPEPMLGLEVSIIEEVRVALLTATGRSSDKFVLLAKSWGGAVATMYASTYPGNLAGLWMSAPAVLQVLGEEPAIEVLRSLRLPVILAWSTDDVILPHEPSCGIIRAAVPCAYLPFQTGNHDAAAQHAAEFLPFALATL